ncbi:hypothetical protein PTSG_11349 [Salpingoeca rosetta]|uniref:Mercuric reductase n=1 Tax=Salpingoeca rosetta (strain ATCC 50818 / BSB-021) TaxID=946362 RepID=F2UT54_SALR5|nr:uncharacterized protein PTSG_11349 [Salpingoeca rosetta]EGD81313.1 hypothetical protein PTSG_11349 [Salpingoeca rosetta]|eukprot:XP_004987709.1 hypothetical protein PTSG_11349 [Salpingoeca rosetta]
MNVDDVAEQVLRGEKDIEEVLGPLTAQGKRELNTVMARSEAQHKPFVTAPSTPMPPIDEYNTKHAEYVHPKDYVNPTPQEEPYDLVVVGAGVAGLLSVIIGNSLGKKCVLIEEHYMGGDCLNVGCFPSKVLIASAKRAHQVRTASDLGVRLDPSQVQVDFPAIMQRMRRLRSEIAPIDSVERYKRDFCHEIFMGHATFTSPSTIDVDGKTIRFHKGREDEDACQLLLDSLRKDGLTVMLNTDVTEVKLVSDRDETHLTKAPFHEYRVTCKGKDGQVHTITCNAVLNATGRIPNVQDLSLEKANVEYDTLRGVRVNEFYQSSNPNVYACGDVASGFKFTHSADWGARIAVRNMFLGMFHKESQLVIPWCTYTDPEVAHVGKYARDLERDGVAYEVLRRDLSHVDRCKCDGDTVGFVKLLVRAGGDEILGATVVGATAGDMLSEITMAMQVTPRAVSVFMRTPPSRPPHMLFTRR